MTPLLSDFEFLRPWFLILIIFLIFFFRIMKRRISAFSSWENVCDAPLLKYLLTPTTETSQKARLFWLFWTLFFAIIALSGPSFYKTKQPSAIFKNPLMIVLDLSTQMNRSDIRPSRLSNAKITITDILEKTHASPSGLIVYTGEPFVVSPLSEDPKLVINLLPAIQTDIMPLQGNRLDRAIDLAVQRLEESRQISGNILVLTSLDTQMEKETLQSASNAFQKGFRVSVYDVSLSPNESLEELAKKGSGIYGGFFDNGSTTIADFIASFHPKHFEKSENETITLEDNGWFFVFISAFGLLYFFKKGAVLLFILCFLSNVSYAGFFLNSDQEGAHAYAFEKYDLAAEKFQNPDWKAAALYKAGRYKEALKYLENKTDERSLYNKGNALAKSGDYESAIKTYEEVLKLNPQNEDARFNLEYLKQMEKDNQSASSDSSDQNKNQEQKENQNQNQNQEQQEQNKQNQEQQQDQNEQQQQQEQEQNQSESEEQKAKDQEQNQDQSQDSSSQSNNETEQQKQEENQEESQKQNSMQKESENNEKEKNDKKIPNTLPQELQTGDKNDKYDEQIQVREQRFREIKEDTGGLLKALIKEEYLKKRY